MLKTDNVLLLALILLPSDNWGEMVTYPLAFLGGLAMRNAFEWENNTLTKKSFAVRLFYTFSLSVLVFLGWTKDDIHILGFTINRAVGLFFITLASDIVVKRLIKFVIYANERWFKKQEERL